MKMCGGLGKPWKIKKIIPDKKQFLGRTIQAGYSAFTFLYFSQFYFNEFKKRYKSIDNLCKNGT